MPSQAVEIWNIGTAAASAKACCGLETGLGDIHSQQKPYGPIKENSMTTAIQFLATATLLLGSALSVQAADRVGEVGVDWTGNDIVVDAVPDPKVQGVTCHVTYFDRGVIDRLRKGNWFEDPSNSSIACRQTGPLVIGDIDLSKDGEEVFKAGLSLVWKSLVVNRIYDRKNDTLIYLIHSREVVDGSAKMAISTVPLYNQKANWEKGKPE